METKFKIELCVGWILSWFHLKGGEIGNIFHYFLLLNLFWVILYFILWFYYLQLIGFWLDSIEVIIYLIFWRLTKNCIWRRKLFILQLRYYACYIITVLIIFIWCYKGLIVNLDKFINLVLFHFTHPFNLSDAR